MWQALIHSAALFWQALIHARLTGRRLLLIWPADDSLDAPISELLDTAAAAAVATNLRDVGAAPFLLLGAFDGRLFPPTLWQWEQGHAMAEATTDGVAEVMGGTSSKAMAGRSASGDRDSSHDSMAALDAWGQLWHAVSRPLPRPASLSVDEYAVALHRSLLELSPSPRVAALMDAVSLASLTSGGRGPATDPALEISGARSRSATGSSPYALGSGAIAIAMQLCVDPAGQPRRFSAADDVGRPPSLDGRRWADALTRIPPELLLPPATSSVAVAASVDATAAAAASEGDVAATTESKTAADNAWRVWCTIESAVRAMSAARIQWPKATIGLSLQVCARRAQAMSMESPSSLCHLGSMCMPMAPGIPAGTRGMGAAARSPQGNGPHPNDRNSVHT